jgi:hypothetical protein
MERVQSLKGWDEYLDKSSKLSILRTETQKVKNSVREALRERLDETGEIDFAAEGDRIRVFRVFRKQQPGRRTRSLDLSSSFRENNDPALDLNPTTEEPSANLDPVTERLLAMMKAKTVS